MECKHELVVPSDGLPFRMFIFEGKNGRYKVARHWHRCLEIFLVLEGAIDFYRNETCCHLEGRDYVIVNSNEIHSIDAPKPNATVVLQIPPDAFGQCLGDAPYLPFSRKEAKAWADGQLVGLVEDMYRTYQEEAYGYQLEVMGRYYFLLHLLATCFQDPMPDPMELRQKRHLDRLSDITEYMGKHYDQQLPLEMVAKRFGFSPTYLSHMFQRYAKVSFRGYLLDLRMEHGVKALLNTQEAIGDIAVSHGFPDGRAFAKAFRKRYGCLPSQYRKDMGWEGR